MAVVNDVVTRFSFTGSPKKLQDFNKSLATSVKTLAKWGAGLVAAATGAALFINKVAKSNDALIQLSKTTGVSIEQIQKLGFAASQLGATTEDVESAISSLSATIGSAALKGNESFQRLGISVRNARGEIKSADKVLLEISDRFNRFNLSLSQKQSLASQLGIDKKLVQLLSASSKELKTLFKSADKIGILSTKDAKVLAQYNNSIKRLSFSFKAITNQIAIGFVPMMQGLSDRFVKFGSNNKQLVKDLIAKTLRVFKAVGQSIFDAGRRVGKFIGVIINLGKFLGVTKGFVIGFGIALAAAFFPVTTIVAGITALVLVIDDMIVGFEGGRSAIFGFIKNTEDGEEVLNDMATAINTVTDAFTALVDFVTKNPVFETFSKWNNQLKQTVKFVSKLKSDLITGAINSFQPNTDSALVGDASVERGGIGSPLASGLGSPSALGLGLAPSNTTRTLNNNNVNQDININIQSNNPDEVGQAVNDTLQNQINNANDQFNVGGT